MNQNKKEGAKTEKKYLGCSCTSISRILEFLETDRGEWTNFQKRNELAALFSRNHFLVMSNHLLGKLHNSSAHQL